MVVVWANDNELPVGHIVVESIVEWLAILRNRRPVACS